MISDLLKKYTSPEKRSKLIGLTTTSLALVYHLLIQYTFYRLNVMPMVFYNIISVTCFLSLIITVLKVKTMIIPYAIACVEVMIHQIFSDLYLGTVSGFHYFILVTGLLPFLVFGSKFKLSALFTFITSAIFVVFENIEIMPFVSIPARTVRIIRFFNISFSILIVLLTNLIHTFIVYVAENNLESKNKKLDQEIKMASVIQQSFFKNDISELKGVDVAYYSKAMAGVSGDIYDFYKNGETLEGIAIFDVSGHGISSGLVTMLVKNIIHDEFNNHKDLELWEILNNINDRVIEAKGDIENYLTGILVRYMGNKLEIAIAGHPKPIFHQKSTERSFYFTPVKESVGAVGISGLPVYYTSDYVDFEAGDELILYSDGVCDVQNIHNEAFGEERLLKAVESVISDNAGNQLSEIAKKIKLFKGTKQQNDDITLIILRKTDE